MVRIEVASQALGPASGPTYDGTAGFAGPPLSLSRRHHENGILCESEPHYAPGSSSVKLRTE